ncbi:MAG: hypothetical protein M3R55_03695 [Acidobacteriota bacterium]|nr:hypothetical protein [Acidobacteriota bacterium]
MTDGVRRALRAWPIALTLTALAALPLPTLGWHDRLAAADFGLGGFPFNISTLDYYIRLGAGPFTLLALCLLLWAFLSSGLIDRLARDRRTDTSRFFSACGACVFPILRLTLLALAVYAAILRWIEPRLQTLAASYPDDLPRMATNGAIALLLFAVATLFDYARVRLVIEDRRSAIGALGASARFIRANPGRVAAIQLTFWLVTALWIAANGGTPPDSTPRIWLLVLGEVFLKLALTGTQVSLYQEKLASAGWVARAAPRWPDDASANPAAL